MSKPGERDLRDAKDAIVQSLVGEQVKRGMLPDTQRVEAWLDLQKTLRKLEDFDKPDAPATAPVVQRPTEEQREKMLLGFDAEAAKMRQRAGVGQRAAIGAWLQFVADRDPEIRAEMTEVVMAGMALDPATMKWVWGSPLHRERMAKVVAHALDKWGDPLAPREKRIQVG